VSAITVNDLPALEGAITIPRVGVPTLTASLLERDAPGKTVTVRIGSSSWVMTVTRSGAHGGRRFVHAVGGAAGLSAIVPPKSYRGVPLRIPLADLAQGVGERLSPASSAAILGLVLPAWIRFEQPAARALHALLGAAGSPAWRILPDGTLWVGVETWPATRLEAYTTIAEGPHRGVVELVAMDPTIAPGETFEGRKVSGVEHRIVARRLRTILHMESA
jgi:hypothetical protein